MRPTDAVFTGAMPEIYERQLGPVLFEPYAQDLAARFQEFAGEFLETACGSGRATRALVAAASPEARFTATDLNQAMVELASRLTPAPNVEWRQADALHLPYPHDSFDAGACQFGVMFFPDKAKGLSEARRVVKPGCRFVFSVWDGLDANPAAKAVHEAVSAAFPERPPGFLGRVPYGWCDEHTIRETVLGEAAFSRVELERVRLEGRASSAHDLAMGLCLGSPLRMEVEEHGRDALPRAVDAAAAALERAFGTGAFAAPMQALVMTAWS
jgi:SAM-dependent methyltransferase